MMLAVLAITQILYMCQFLLICAFKGTISNLPDQDQIYQKMRCEKDPTMKCC